MRSRTESILGALALLAAASPSAAARRSRS